MGFQCCLWFWFRRIISSHRGRQRDQRRRHWALSGSQEKWLQRRSNRSRKRYCWLSRSSNQRNRRPCFITNSWLSKYTILDRKKDKAYTTKGINRRSLIQKVRARWLQSRSTWINLILRIRKRYKRIKRIRTKYLSIISIGWRWLRKGKGDSNIDRVWRIVLRI